MAKKFKLQSVLNYRESLENQAQQKLAASMQRKTDLQVAQQEQQDRLRQHDAELCQRQKDGLTVAEMDLFESSISHCRYQIAQLQEQLTCLEQQIVKERAALLAATRDRQIMEKLKEKQEAEYQQELNRKEREMLDEVSLRNTGEKI